MTDEISLEHLFTTDFQRSILSMLATNLVFSIHYGDLVKEEYFETQPARSIYRIIKEYVLTYEKELDLSSVQVKISDYALSHGFTGETIKELHSEAKAIFAVHIKSEQFVIDHLIKFARRQELKQALFKSVDILEKDGSPDKVLALIDRAVSVGIGIDEGMNFNDLYELPSIYLDKYNPENLITTGLPSLDKALKGGMAPGELHIVIAPPKVGKSSLAAAVGAANIRKGKAVFHITLEIKKEDVAMKYAMNLSNLTMEQICNLDDRTYKHKIGYYEKLKPKLFINHWSEGTVNTLTIRGWISRMRSKTGINPDLIIVDYDDPLVGETKIPLLDGTEVEIKDLLGKEEFWVYACKEDGTIAPGKGHSARVARHVDELIEITLDNGRTIKSTINHNHMLRDGSYKRADQFVVGDSMMPLYTRADVKSPDRKYLEVLDNKTGKYKSVHRMVYNHENPETNINELDVHHKNENPHDNRPCNLELLTKSEHLNEHWKNPEFREIVVNKANEQWKDDKFRSAVQFNSIENAKIIKERKCKSCGQVLNVNVGGLISHTKVCLKETFVSKQDDFVCRICKQHYFGTEAAFKTHETRCKRKSLGLGINGKPRLDWKGDLAPIPHNHKVVSVKKIKLEEPVPVYCLTVDNYHNYALSAGVFTHNCLVPTGGKSDSMYDDGSNVYTDLIGLADYFKVPVCSYAQPQREAWNLPNEGKMIQSFHLAHSARKAHKCYSVSSLNFEDEKSVGVLWVDMNRRGDSKIKVRLKRDLAHCSFTEVEGSN